MEPGIGIGGPIDILKLLIDTPVTVYLKDASILKGVLKGFDEHINIFLAKAFDGTEKHDILFIRGDLVSIVREGNN